MDVKQEYLRISLTDKCNYRCKYCLPNGNINSIENNKFLEIEEYFQLAKVFNNLIGLKKIRLTGGEPLLIKGLMSLVQMLSTLDPKPEISITTNGHYLFEKIDDLIISGIEISFFIFFLYRLNLFCPGYIISFTPLIFGSFLIVLMFSLILWL